MIYTEIDPHWKIAQRIEFCSNTHTNIGPHTVIFICAWRFSPYLISFVESVGPQGKRRTRPCELLHAHTHAVSRTIVWTFVSLTSSSGEAVEACALTGCSVARASVWAFDHGVSCPRRRWYIWPSSVWGTRSLRAIWSFVECYVSSCTPPLITRACTGRVDASSVTVAEILHSTITAHATQGSKHQQKYNHQKRCTALERHICIHV